MLSKENSVHLFVLIALAFILVSCGGGSSGSDDFVSTPGGGSDEDDIDSNPGDEPDHSFFLFEGASFEIDFSDFAEVAWEQTGGPDLIIEPTAVFNTLRFTAPWMLGGDPIVATIQVQAVGNDESAEVVELTVRNRRFVVIQTENADAEQALVLNYVAGSDGDSVLTFNAVPLVDLPEGIEVCSYSISPTGQYIAYSIFDEASMFTSDCQEINLVDIETQVSQSIGLIGSEGNAVTAGFFRWSPDGSKLAYRANYGENSDITQHYIYDLNEGTTSYINYDNNDLASGQWPDENLYPMMDGGNDHGSSSTGGYGIAGLSWQNNNNGVAFQVYDQDEGEFRPHLASIHGDARLLQRGASIDDRKFSLDEETLAEWQEERNNCPDGSVCTVLPVPPVPLIVNQRRFTNVFSLESSIEGHLSIFSNIQYNNSSVAQVLAVRRPVVDGEDVSTYFSSSDGSDLTIIEAEEVIDAEWSPVAPHLAFASESEERHSHIEDTDSDITLDDFRVGPEIPGQLYFYYDYELNHETAQERLAYPQPDIDENDVVDLAWAESGDYIAYARGELEEGPFLTSLWVTAIDDVRDETTGTIDANTTLLTDFRDDNDYISEFMWSPDDSGVLALVQNIDDDIGSFEQPSLRYFARDGGGEIDITTLLRGGVTDAFYFVTPAFSPDSQYVAYRDDESDEVNAPSAIYVKDINGGDPAIISVPLQAGGFLREFYWLPDSSTILYSARIATGEDELYYFANIAGENSSLNMAFLQALEDSIVRVRLH